MAVCLLLVDQIHQIARYTKYIITLEVILHSLHRSLLWYVQVLCPFQQCCCIKQLWFARHRNVLVLCQGHQDWLFGMTWLTDRHIVTGALQQ